MTAAFLLVALAVLVAPGRPAVSERLAVVAVASRPRAAAAAFPPWRSAVLFAAAFRARRAGGAAGEGPPPRVYELLAVSLRSGLPPHLAVGAVAEALRPPGDRTDAHPDTHPGARPDDLAEALATAAGRMRLGAGPASACAGADPGGRLDALGVVLERAATGGGGAVAALEHSAERARAAEDAAAVARAERAGVLVAGPLGLCFLPAFVCLGIAPVVVGLAGDILPGVTP